MHHTCKLHSKCVKEDESLEKCEVAECKHIIHPSCCKKLMTIFGEDDWEGPFFCEKTLNAASKAQGRVPWHSDGPISESIPRQLLLTGWQLVTITIDGSVVIKKVLQNESLQKKCLK